ncbi:TonB-dependent receptor plug domain-containing protein [Acinetobacter sp. TSRC1-2]|uniref:TonB-dependent receptor plug domain-containing protein n=1 Tax=unclassified Acinetobacter TaxID=196816 RepID=UPI003CEBAD59
MRFNRSSLSFAILIALSTSIHANDLSQTATSASIDSPIPLIPIVMQAEKTDETGTTVYTKEDLDKIPNSSKNISDLLKVNPNVQFDKSYRSGKQQGELSPAEISINGSLPYENKFLINGLSINNNINPAGGSNNNSNMDLMGSSQTVAVNTDLICNLTVLDSNISAEYGEFTGGVVSADTCMPKTAIGKIHGSLSYDYTSDHWSRINYINETEQEKFENSTGKDYQRYFTKQGISATTYGNLTDNLGLNVFGSYRRSDIPLQTELLEPSKFDQQRESSNAGFEAFYTPNDQTSLKFGTQFFESEGLYFQSNSLDSDSIHTSNSQNFYINLKNKLNHVDIEQQLNYQTQTAARDGEQDAYAWTKSITKNWSEKTAQNEGTFGSMEQQEEKLEYSFKALFEPIQTDNFSHTFKMGAGYGHYEAYWARPVDTYWYTGFANLNGNSCRAPDGTSYDACDEGRTILSNYQGQFLKNRFSYREGIIDVQQDRWHAFLENKIQWNKYITATLGFRTDYDSLTKNNNIAPRTAFVFRPWGDDHFLITTGWNRYYGLNAFFNELQDRKDRLQTKETRNNANEAWKTDDSYAIATGLRSELNTPYSDEILFAMNGKYRNLDMGLKWVNRDNKDQINQTTSIMRPEITGSTTQKTWTYDNSGRSESNIYTFTIKNINPIELRNSFHHLSLAADYTDTTRNFTDYTTNYNGTSEVYYGGKLINAREIPASNYNTPWTVRLGWDIQFSNTPLRINNFFSYRAKMDAMQRKALGYTDSDGHQYDLFTPIETKNAFNWDIRATYLISVSKNLDSILGLTVNNVINRHNSYVNNEGTTNSEIGRQFIADITFKF